MSDEMKEPENVRLASKAIDKDEGWEDFEENYRTLDSGDDLHDGAKGEFKIIALQIDGIRKLTAIEMKFKDKGLIRICGKNKQGKTSVLDSLEILLKGTKYLEKDMLQHGKDRSEVVATIGDYIVKRVITAKSNRLEIKTVDGGLQMTKKPQAFLDTLINELTFDPRPFLNKSPEQKLQFMMGLLKIDFNKQNYAIDELETERLLVGREVKKIGDVAKVEKVEKVNVQDLIAKKQEIQKHNNHLQSEHSAKKTNELKKVIAFNDEQRKKQEVVNRYEMELGRSHANRLLIVDEITKLKEKLDTTEWTIATRKEEMKKLDTPQKEKSIDIKVPLPPLRDEHGYDKQIIEASEINQKASQYELYLSNKQDKETKEKEYKSHTDSINALNEEKKKILSDTKIPVAGLEIREDGLYHNGIFSENWSESEGLRISSELCIAMQPKLKSIFIDKGESYDKDSLKDLEEWAVEHGIQAFITIVSDIPEHKEDGVFYIEEGKIK